MIAPIVDLATMEHVFAILVMVVWTAEFSMRKPLLAAHCVLATVLGMGHVQQTTALACAMPGTMEQIVRAENSRSQQLRCLVLAIARGMEHVPMERHVHVTLAGLPMTVL